MVKRARRRPRTRVALCLLDARSRARFDNLELHVVPVHYDPETDLTEREQVDDALARLTDGQQGRYASSLYTRALCGRRVHEVPKDRSDVLGAPRCPGCFGQPKPRGA